MTTPTPTPTPDNALPRFVGFCGEAGCGKTLASDWVMENFGHVRLFRFSATLKKMLYELLRSCAPKDHPVGPKDYLNDPILKNEPIPYLGGVSARTLMQTLGTEWGRNLIHPDFWVMITAAKFERLAGHPYARGQDGSILAVSDDVRFPNEVDMIHAYGGLVIEIKRPNYANHLTPEAKTHVSEKRAFTPDYTVTNAGTPEDLYVALARILPPPPPKA